MVFRSAIHGKSQSGQVLPAFIQDDAGKPFQKPSTHIGAKRQMGGFYEKQPFKGGVSMVLGKGKESIKDPDAVCQ